MSKLKFLFFAITLSFTHQAISQAAIQVEKSGAGSPAVYLPGFTVPGEIWQETIANLNDSYENHVVTYAGFGGVPAIELPWYDKIKSDLLDYFQTNDLENVTLIGHSMGGNLAMEVAAELPERITNLILVDSLPNMREVMMPGVSADQIVYDNPYSQQMMSMSVTEFDAMASQMAATMATAASDIDQLKTWMIESDRSTYVHGYTDLLKLDLRDSLSNITARTLILGASFPNAEIVLTTLNAQYASLTDKTIVIAEDSLHFIMLDQPQWFYNQINAFLDNNDRD